MRHMLLLTNLFDAVADPWNPEFGTNLFKAPELHFRFPRVYRFDGTAVDRMMGDQQQQTKLEECLTPDNWSRAFEVICGGEPDP